VPLTNPPAAELTHFYDVVNQAGFEIDIASPKGGAADGSWA
jgi:putative intracellular protease/amidase